MPHLTYAHYLAVLEGELPVALLHQQALQHLLDGCPACRREWEGEGLHGPGERRVEYNGGVEELKALLGFGSEPRAISLAQIEACGELVKKTRRAARHARTDLQRLVSLPVEEWPHRVANARTRMRSRSFAELLIEEARNRVKGAPKEAMVLAGLVKPALDRRPGRLELTWARVLLARARAHHANALRVAGDLTTADVAFAELRADLGRKPLEEPALLAEIASLEASLRVDQRRIEAADDLLREASQIYSHACHKDGQARTLVQRANLAQTNGRPDDALRLLKDMENLGESVTAPYACSALAARVAALCDLERPGEGRRLLEEHDAARDSLDEPHSATIFLWLEGRTLLGLGELGAAEERFRSATAALRKLGRDYDAALASLDLAQALLRQGRTGELARLAVSLAGEFRSREVAPETRESLRLFEQAARAESLTLALLLDLRQRLQRIPPTFPRGKAG